MTSKMTNVIFIIFTISLFPGCNPEQSPKTFKKCGFSQAGILNTWAHPELFKIDKGNKVSLMSGWEASLWLPEHKVDSNNRCHLSCASDQPLLSMVLMADRPVTMVMLSDYSSNNNTLDIQRATLTAPGNSPISTVTIPEVHRNTPVHSFLNNRHQYLISFPPIKPEWKKLEVNIPFQKGGESIRIRFSRKI